MRRATFELGLSYLYELHLINMFDEEKVVEMNFVILRQLNPSIVAAELTNAKIFIFIKKKSHLNYF